MSRKAPVTEAQVRVLEQVVDLDLSEERRARLVTWLSAYLANATPMRAIDTQGIEPPVLTIDLDREEDR